MNLCDIAVIKSVLKRHGFNFSKGLGQNFLCDAEVPRQIAARSGADKDTTVLEVGPGMGCLSRELCARAAFVAAVELDGRLAPVLRETLADCDNFALVQGDILKTDIRELCGRYFGGRRAIACANLPYYITTPAITALIDSGCFSSVTVMVQKEVARRICAAPDTADYGAFSLYIAYHAQAEIILEVPSTSFVPQPKVDSAVVRLDIRSQPPVDADRELLFRLIKAAFLQRRKTLVNCLRSYFPGTEREQWERVLERCGLDVRVRGEALGLESYAALAKTIDFL